MKKTTITLAILALLLFASCVPETEIPPYGVWVSEEPKITLFITPEYRIPVGPPSYFGVYMVNDIKSKIFAQFDRGRHFVIYDLSETRGGAHYVTVFGERGQAGGICHSGSLLSGSYRLIGGELQYMLGERSQEILGIKTIIFQLSEDYEPIDPEWIANFEVNP